MRYMVTLEVLVDNMTEKEVRAEVDKLLDNYTTTDLGDISITEIEEIEEW